MPLMVRIIPVVLVVLVAGCGSRVATVSGKVTYKGRPVRSGGIVLLNPDGLSIAKGIIQPDGSYVVEGVKHGRVKIGVLSPNPTPAAKVADPAWFPLPASLGSPGTSGLTCEVAAAFVEYDIDIK
jgi:hypothetical protein